MLPCTSTANKGNRWSQTVSARTMLQISFDAARSAREIAAICNVTVAWAKTIRCFVALAYMAVQNMILGSLIASATAARPLLCAVRLAWDETGERLTMPTPGGTSYRGGGQTNSVWHVMVARLRFIVCWESDSPSGVRTFDFTAVLPPMIVQSTSAAALWHQLFHSSLAAPVFRARDLLRDSSRIFVELCETDGAYANDKLLMHLLATSRPEVLWDQWHCSLHQSQLVEASVLSIAGVKLLSRLYSITLFLRTSGHFLRMLRLLKHCIQKNLIIRDICECGPPSQLMKSYTRELVEYLCSHRQRFTRFDRRPSRVGVGEVMSGSESDGRGDAGDDALPRGRREYLKAAQAFSDTWNGPLWEPRFVHYAPAGSRLSESDCAAQMASTCRDFLLRMIPPVPAANKWTKLGPCCDVIMSSLLAHGIFRDIFLGLKFDTSAIGVEESGDLDDQLRSDVQFRAVQGKRFAASCDFLRSAKHVLVLVRLCLVLEPIRFLTAFWLRRASECEDPCSQPPVFDMQHPRYSPLTLACQYLSGLLDRTAERLILLWRTSGHETVEAWFQHAPGEVRDFRRIVMVANCGIYRRHVCRYRSFPWLLCAIADERRPLSERRSIALLFTSASSCCLRPGFANRLHARDLAPEDLLSPPWSQVLRFFAVVFSMQVADVEWRHGRNRQRTHRHGQTSWHQFVARYIAAEAQTLRLSALSRLRVWEERHERHDQQHRIVAGHPGRARVGRGGSGRGGSRGRGSRGSCDAPPNDRQRLRAPSAFDVFRAATMRRDRHMGLKFNPASRDDWASRRSEWEALTDERRQAYADEARHQVGWAAQCRTALRQARRRDGNAEGIAAEGAAPLREEPMRQDLDACEAAHPGPASLASGGLRKISSRDRLAARGPPLLLSASVGKSSSLS